MAKTIKVLLHYWSATGNTALAARTMAEGLSSAGADCEMSDMRTGEVSGLAEADLWVIASPVFDFRPALPVEDFVKARSDLAGKPVAAVFTCSGLADRAPTHLARWLAAAGAKPWDYTLLIAEDSWSIARRFLPPLCSYGHPTENELEALRSWAEDLPGRLAAGEPARSWWRPPTPFTLASFLYWKPLLRRTFTIWVDTDRCTRCGACAAQCPTGRMRLEAFPKPAGECVGCYGCVNVCPVDAVDTWLTRGATRYRGPEGREEED